MKRALAAMAVIAPVLVTSGLSRAQPVSFQGLDFLPNFTTSSRALGVNADGTVVVGFATSGTGINQAFRWANGTLSVLPCGSSCRATGVNADGTVVVGYTSSAGNDQAVQWLNGTMSALPSCGVSCRANGVNSDGTIIVGSITFEGKVYASRWKTNGSIDNLGLFLSYNPIEATGVNSDGTVVVGFGNAAGASQAFRFVPFQINGLGYLGGYEVSSTATGLNADGTVVVGESGSTIGSAPFRWVNGRMFGLGFLAPDTRGGASAVNADGTVVVGRIRTTTAGPRDFAFRWTPTEGIIRIEQLLTAAGVTFNGWQLTQATAISADGRVVVGLGIDPNGKTQGWIARLPIPPLPTNILAAVAPNARTGVANGPAVTGFASIINAGSATAFSCSIGLPGNTPAPGSRRPVLHYQRTNAQNVPIGSQDAPVDITAGATQSFVFSITPAFEGTWSQDIALVFRCFNTAAAPSIPGLNTFLVSISNTAITDMLSIADTPTHDGIADIPGTTGTGLIVTAAVNIGAAGSVVFTPSDTPVGQVPRNLPVNLFICQTNPTTGACVNPATPGASSTVTVAANQTVTFSVFIQGKGTPIPFDPANSRVFIIGTQGATPVGEAGAAIRTQ